MSEFSSMTDADLITACKVDIIASTWVNDAPGPTTMSEHKKLKMAQSEARARGLRYNRFGGLQSDLKSMKIKGRLGTTKGEAAASPSAQPASAPKPKVAAVAKPTPAPRKLGRVETVALAVRTDPKLRGFEDIALDMLDDPDLKGLSGEGVVRCLTGLDPALYRASMAKERAAKADAVWTKARASIDDQRGSPASPKAEPTNQPAPARKLTAAEMRADAVWDRARASIDGSRLPPSAAQKPATGAKTNSTDDIWARAYAAVAR